ncbi:porin family protein [Reichenbachiella versicolor]|uniref:porin family protein n=1 Tax=Reichenbachiella versicolor TaxID=1821036 RepID=UPI000D6E9760|nr:porin family protein [Reichenbachiella versicolor]
MLNNLKYLVIISFFLGYLGPNYAIGQENCTQNLKEANDLYDQGRLVEVLRKLKEGDCLEDGFSKEERTRAYKLLALVYIFMDDEINAEEAVINLLTVDPEHPLDENEPAEFEYMYNKYRSEPIFRLGVYFGGNFTSVNTISEYGTFSTTEGIEKEYTSGLGFHGGFSFEYKPIENLEIVLRGQYSSQNYSVSYPISNVFFVDNLKETMSWLSLPVLLRYNFELEKITPYAFGGASFQYLLSSKTTGDRQGTITRSVSGLDLKSAGLRDQINWNYIAGAGIKLPIKRTNSFFAEVSYNIGGANIVNATNRYKDQDNNFNLAHVDDDKSINHIGLTVGWIKSIYNPKRYSDKKLAKKSGKRDI